MQLVQNRRIIPPKIIKEYLTNYSSPSPTTLSEILRILAQGFDKIYVVLDGLEQILYDSDNSVSKTCMTEMVNILFLLVVTEERHGKGYGMDAGTIIDDQVAIVHSLPRFFFLD